MIAALLGATLFSATVVPGKEPQAVKPFVQVFEENSPDPFVIRSGAAFFAYAANARADQTNIQMAHPTDLLNWKLVRDGAKLHDAMPVLPRCASRGFTWGPEVMKLGNRYVLYFTPARRRPRRNAWGGRPVDDPMGPFAAYGAAPLVCQRDLGGTIDPSAYRDANGKLYLNSRATETIQARSSHRKSSSSACRQTVLRSRARPRC